MNRMKSVLLIYVLLSQSALAQVADYQRDYNKINEHLMLTLGSYAVGNFAVSGAGYFSAEGDTPSTFMK